MNITPKVVLACRDDMFYNEYVFQIGSVVNLYAETTFEYTAMIKSITPKDITLNLADNTKVRILMKHSLRAHRELHCPITKLNRHHFNPSDNFCK